MSKITFTFEELEVGRKAVEDVLVDLRDARIGVLRNNGLCIKESSGEPSSIIRLSIEDAFTIAVGAINQKRGYKS